MDTLEEVLNRVKQRHPKERLSMKRDRVYWTDGWVFVRNSGRTKYWVIGLFNRGDYTKCIRFQYWVYSKQLPGLSIRLSTPCLRTVYEGKIYDLQRLKGDYWLD